MFVLVNKNDNSCCFHGTSIEYGVFDEPIEKWKITNGCTFYAIGDGLERVEVEELPNEYEDLKYCYTETEGFYLNPSYIDPINTEEEVRRLTQENIDLKAQLDKIQKVLDYLVMQ